MNQLKLYKVVGGRVHVQPVRLLCRRGELENWRAVRRVKGTRRALSAQGWTTTRPSPTVTYAPDLEAYVVHYPATGKSALIPVHDVANGTGFGRWPRREWARRARGAAT